MTPLLLDAPPRPHVSAPAPRPRPVVGAWPRPAAPRRRLGLVVSLVLHAGALAAAALWAGASPAPAERTLRVAQMLVPEAPAEAPSEPEEAELLEAPEIAFEPEPLAVVEPEEEPPLVDLELEPAIEAPSIDPWRETLWSPPTDRRRRSPPPPSAPAPTPASVAQPPLPVRAPAPSPAPAAPRPVAAGPVRTPDLPMTASLASLPRPLTVHLILTVEPDGAVSRAVVEAGSGWAAFDEAARQWVVARWRFGAGSLRFRTRVPFHLR